MKKIPAARLDKKYPVEVRMCFKTKDEADEFIAGWLDGGLDQMCNANTVVFNAEAEEQTWRWPKPALYVEIKIPDQ